MRLSRFLQFQFRRSPSGNRLLAESLKQDLAGMFPPLYGSSSILKAQIDREINWARTYLKRRDRAIWYIKRIRARIAFLQITNTNAPEEERQPFSVLFQKYIKADPNVAGDISSGVVGTPEWKTQVGHLIGLNLPEIDQISWTDQSDSTLRIHMTQAENKWLETRGRDIDMSQDPDAEKIMEFPDGFAWFNLNRSVCSIEAQSMGHCGNSQYRNGTILSLRQQDKRKENLWYPVATFILHDNGYIGEMKGRGNKKPIEAYHKYIVALLRHDLIKGIKGGGYAPHENFSIHDLDAKTREELIAQKPELEGPESLMAQYKRTGSLADVNFDGIPADMRPYRYETVEDERGHKLVLLDHIGDREDLLKKMAEYITPLRELLTLQSNMDGYSWEEQLRDPHFLEELYRSVSPRTQAWIRSELHLGQRNAHLGLVDALQKGGNPRLIQILRRAFALTTQIDPDTVRKGIEERLNRYLENSYLILCIYSASIELVETDYYVCIEIYDYLQGLDVWEEAQNDPDSDFDSDVWTSTWDQDNDGPYGDGGDDSHIIDRLEEEDLIEKINPNDNSYHAIYRDSEYGYLADKDWIDDDLPWEIAKKLDQLVAGELSQSGPQQDDETLPMNFG